MNAHCRLVFAGLVIAWLPAATASSAAPEIAPLEQWQAALFWVPDSPHPGLAAAGQRPRVNSAVEVPLAFVAIEPCRLIDTRLSGSLPQAIPEGYGPPSLLATPDTAPLAMDRVFQASGAGHCGITAGVRGISVRVIALNYAASGQIVIYPEGSQERPHMATLRYQTESGIASTTGVVPLSADGKFAVHTSQTTDVIVDVNGYYLQDTVVTSINGLQGDVTVAAGADLTLTPSGQTLTLAVDSTSENVAGKVVRRDGTGNFSAGTITANLDGRVTGAASANVLKSGDLMTGSLTLSPGNIDLATEPSAAWGGSLLKNGIPFLHDFGTSNTFAGLGAGNFTMGTGGSGNGHLGGFNSSLGASTLRSNTTGFANVAVGAFALFENTIGQENTAVGFQAMFNNVSGQWNSALGFDALLSNTSGFSNVAIGLQSLYTNTVGAWNVGVGVGTLQSNADGISNTAVGAQALYMNTNGGQNTGIGDSALFFNTTGHFNAALGDAACMNNTTGTSNSCVGHGTLYSNTRGSSNTAVGESALFQNDADGNTATGAFSMRANVTGAYNVANGTLALGNNVGGSHNVAFGYAALNGETNNSTAVGSNALAANVSGGQNTAVGSGALSGSTAGGDNTAVGVAAGWTVTAGSGNTFIGMLADAAVGGLRNATALGARAVVGSSNTVVLGNGSVTDVVAGTNGQAVVHGAGFMAVSADLPAPGPDLAGQIRYLAGGPGVKDQVVVCAKDAADTWAWRVLF